MMDFFPTSTGMIDVNTLQPPTVVQDTTTIIYADNTLIVGDLIVVGNINKGILIPLTFKQIQKIINYLFDIYDLKEGTDFFEVKDGIIIKEKDSKKYHDFITEALI